MKSMMVAAFHFMLDALIISLVLVFFFNELALALVWSWLLVALLISIIAYFVFIKRSYQLAWAIGISVMAAGGMWSAGVGLGLALILGMLFLYLLHKHYSANYEKINQDHHFLMKFILVFSLCWVVLLINPNPQTSQLLFIIAPLAILFYVAGRLLSGYFLSRKDGVRFSQVAKAFGIIASVPAVAAICTFFFADEVRKLAGLIMGGAIQVLFWPLALLLEQITEFLSGLSTEKEMQETIDKLGQEESSAANDSAITQTTSADFPVEVLLAIVVLACAVALVLWLKKVKPETALPEKESSVTIARHNHPPVQQLVQTPVSLYSQTMDLHQIREVFRELEHAAKEHGMEREDYETVREWMARMQWDVTESFYTTYDQVRYGDKPLPEMQTIQFINEIKKIKGKYLKENV